MMESRARKTLASVMRSDMMKSFVKLVVAAATITATVLVFYFTMESRQDGEITKTTTSLTEHVKQADKTFEKIDCTMLDQRTANEEMRDTLVEVSTVQRSIKEENGRLADTIKELAKELRRRNGPTPP